MDAVEQVAAQPAGPLAIGDPHIDKPFKGDVGGSAHLRPPAASGRGRSTGAARADPLHPGRRRRASARRTRSSGCCDYFLTYDAPADLRQAYRELNSLKDRLAQVKKKIVNVQVMAEMARPRDTFVLGRGDYRNHGEKVTPGVPALLPPLPKDAPANRLGLAEWLFSPQHPLTARVAVNRYWQLYFGIGLVKTAEDFGSQGDAPVYRDLLDWLALRVPEELGHQGHAAADRHLGHLPAVVRR